MLNSACTGRTKLARTPTSKVTEREEYDTGLQNHKWLNKTVRDSFMLFVKNHGPPNEDSGSWFKANKMRLIFTARNPTGVTN